MQKKHLFDFLDPTRKYSSRDTIPKNNNRQQDKWCVYHLYGEAKSLDIKHISVNCTIAPHFTNFFILHTKLHSWPIIKRNCIFFGKRGKMAGTQLIERKQKMNCQLWQNLLNCFYCCKCDEFIALLYSIDFFVKKIKVWLQPEPYISTERSFLKHFVLCNRSLVFKYQRDLYFSQKINAIKIKWLPHHRLLE
jgi:hypothetical protein